MHNIINERKRERDHTAFDICDNRIMKTCFQAFHSIVLKLHTQSELINIPLLLTTHTPIHLHPSSLLLPLSLSISHTLVLSFASDHIRFIPQNHHSDAQYFRNGNLVDYRNHVVFHQSKPMSHYLYISLSRVYTYALLYKFKDQEL